MVTSVQAHIAVLLTVLFTVYGQIIIKYQVLRAGPSPTELAEKARYVLSLLLNPWVISGFGAAFLAAVCWIVAMTRLELSYAYPFMGVTFLLVYAAGIVLFGEVFSIWRSVGVALIITGVVVLAQN